MTLIELHNKINELLTHMPPDTQVVVAVGVFKGQVREKLSEADEWKESILTFGDGLKTVTSREEPDEEDEKPWITLEAGPELEIPPVM